MVRVFGCQGSGFAWGVAVHLPAAAGTLPPLLPPPPPTTPKGFDIPAVDSHSGRLRDKSTEAGGILTVKACNYAIVKAEEMKKAREEAKANSENQDE